jgi:hypothetical protein
VDQTRVLANDGSSADLLMSVLALSKTFDAILLSTYYLIVMLSSDK